MRIRSTLAAVLLAGLGAAGCTTTQAPTTVPTPTVTSSTSASPSASPTPSATPTQTLDANQAAAVAAVKGFWAADTKVGADPAAFTKAQMNAELGRYLGGDALTSQVGYFARLKSKGYRLLGDTTAVWIKTSDATDNHSARGLEVHVTACQDQTTLSVVDKSGQKVADQQFPTFNLRQYSVRKPANATRWRIYGAMAASGECGR